MPQDQPHPQQSSDEKTNIGSHVQEMIDPECRTLIGKVMVIKWLLHGGKENSRSHACD